MQIDLLATPRGEVGLVCNKTFEADVSCVIFDVAERSMTLEFGASMDSMKLNVPVGDDFLPLLRGAEYLHFCSVEKGRITYARQVPLLRVSVDEDDIG